ncbi:conserved hypothetical protein [Nitrosomonas mobilis]|uniref:Uncharacterized protein n=1 Tax=Nitrosomonas mobilis TaxID=51642 RepID=A0A1G5SGY4_9PROT|nr:conserved hypothetical protein [Nitrosomonas mobilis]
MPFCYQNYWSLVPPLFSGVLIIGGWFVVHKATLSRERRKEKREIINNVLEEIRAIESIAVDFHNSVIFDGKVNSNITLRIDRLSRKLQATPFAELGISRDLMIQIRQAITLKHFDKSDFPTVFQRITQRNPYSASHIEILIKDINAATDDLIDCIETAKNTNFP